MTGILVSQPELINTWLIPVQYYTIIVGSIVTVAN